MSSYRYTRAQAGMLGDHYVEEALANEATTLPRAILVAEKKLNRAARRALGGRSDGRYHPAATLKRIPRTR